MPAKHNALLTSKSPAYWATLFGLTTTFSALTGTALLSALIAPEGWSVLPLIWALHTPVYGLASLDVAANKMKQLSPDHHASIMEGLARGSYFALHSFSIAPLSTASVAYGAVSSGQIKRPLDRVFDSLSERFVGLFPHQTPPARHCEWKHSDHEELFQEMLMPEENLKHSETNQTETQETRPAGLFFMDKTPIQSKSKQSVLLRIFGHTGPDAAEVKQASELKQHKQHQL